MTLLDEPLATRTNFDAMHSHLAASINALRGRVDAPPLPHRDGERFGPRDFAGYFASIQTMRDGDQPAAECLLDAIEPSRPPAD